MSVAGWASRAPDSLFAWSVEEPRPEALGSAFRSPKATQVLTASAIPLSEAFKRGVRWVSGVNDAKALRPEFSGKGIPDEGDWGLIFPHYSLDGERTLQYRPDQPYAITFADGTQSKPRKYDWGRSGASGASVGLNAALRIENGTARRLAIVEGTKQALAADIWAPDDVAVVGIQGIWNGQKKGIILPDLAALAPRFRDIIVIPDGDVASNAHVWDGADLLRDLLHSAAPSAVVRVALLPSENKEGLDDALGRIAAEERGRYIADLLDRAGVMPTPPEGAKTVAAPEERNIWQRFNAAVDAAETVVALYGGDLNEEGLELPEGTLTVGRFRDGSGFVKADNVPAANLLRVSVGKVATASTILIGAVGKKGAYRILDAHKDAPEDLLAWVEEYADNLDAGVAGLADAVDQQRQKAATRREHTEVTKAFNALYSVADLGADPAEYLKASQAARVYAKRKGLDPYFVMESLIEQRLAEK